ncbi:glycosyltransferase [Treponema bryantii]|uniref:glycosyltransferase n=1 Tax=Treponema bryantii TaxID=163 RepID=UPI002B286C3F|nr:hypothetical protein TRBR_13800 [Treponema bryantii]
MKFVYVLTSTPKDLYYEQCLMSVWSLRQKMPNADIIVLVDDKTASSFTLEYKRTELKSVASLIKTIDFDNSVTNIERSRLIKTSIPDYVEGSFLYIDCDTIICDDLSSIKNESFETAGVLDGHCMLEDHIHKNYFLKRDKKLGFKGTQQSECNINGGIILAKEGEQTKQLFKTWNEVWKYSAYKKHDFHDQSALNEANYRTGLKMGHLNGIWNCQPSHGGLAYLKDAKIIHYYSSEFSGKNYIPYYKLADKNLQNRIKESGAIPEDIQKMILEPKFQFNNVHLINDKRIVSIMQSPLTFTLADIKEKLPGLFTFMEVQASFLRTLGKKLKK